jgi:hypothetical protein
LSSDSSGVSGETQAGRNTAVGRTIQLAAIISESYRLFYDGPIRRDRKSDFQILVDILVLVAFVRPCTSSFRTGLFQPYRIVLRACDYVLFY